MTQHNANAAPQVPQGNPNPEPTESLLERAIKAFESGGLRPDAQPAPVAQPAASAPVQPVQAAPVAQPAPVEPAPVQAAPAQSEVAPQGRFCRVDRHRVREAGLIVPEAGITGQLEEFRIIKRQLLVQADNLRRAGGGSAAQRLLVTSALPGEGKSFCAANLALSIAAEKDCDVLLVDFDSAKNTVLSSLGLPNGPGLIDAIADPTLDIRSCVIATDVAGLSVLPGGRATSHDNEYMASARATEVLDQLTEGNPRRIVVLDSPPTLAASLPVELAKLVGQVVVVVAADSTNQSAIEDAVSLLSGCPNLQLLLNGVQFSPSGRRYGTYYR
jgi:Mrp family chromosome partitioning ATPase